MRQFALEDIGVAVFDMKTFVTCLTLDTSLWDPGLISLGLSFLSLCLIGLNILIDTFLLRGSLILIFSVMKTVMKEKDAEKKRGWQR